MCKKVADLKNILTLDQFQKRLIDFDANILLDMNNLGSINPGNFSYHSTDFRKISTLLNSLANLHITLKKSGVYKNKDNKVYLTLNIEAVLLAALFIKTRINCGNFSSFYKTNDVLLGTLIYKIQCFVFVRYSVQVPVEGTLLPTLLTRNDYKELTVLYMKLLTVYDKTVLEFK